MDINTISGMIIEAAMRVHTALGPGLLKSAYEACLLHELRKMGLKAVSQLALPIVYDGVTIDTGYRIDCLVEDLVIVELKAVEKTLPIHEAQLISYLKLSKKNTGFAHQFQCRAFKRGDQENRQWHVRVLAVLCVLCGEKIFQEGVYV